MPKYLEDFAAYSINQHKNEGITVILPTYNMGESLKRAIDSILYQTQLPEEILIIDDCSTDNTSAILDSYAGCSLISWVRLGKNIGVSQCRNLGLLLSKGAYITFHDADDVCEKNKLESQIDLLNTPSIGFTGNPKLAIRQKSLPRGFSIFPDIAACSSKIIGLGGNIHYESPEVLSLISYFFPNLCLSMDDSFLNGIIASMINRQVFRDLGGFSSYRVNSDSEFRNRTVAYGSIYTIDKNYLYTIYKSRNSLTTSKLTGIDSPYRKKVRKKILKQSIKMLKFRKRKSFLNKFSIKIDIPDLHIESFYSPTELTIATDIPCTTETRNQIIDQLTLALVKA